MSALEKHGSALDASSTGCGKTVIAAEIASVYKRPTFVICNKSSIPMWKEELEEHGWPAFGIINYEMLRTGKTPWGKWAPGKLWRWSVPQNTQFIWDEVHKCQGMSSLNSRMLISAKPFSNLLLSATAAENPADMRAMGYVLGLHGLRNFWAWAQENGCTPNQWGKLDFNNSEDVMQKLHTSIFPDHGSRLTVNDLREHFQETTIITTPLEFGDRIKNIYDQMEKELGDLKEIMLGDSQHPAARALVAKLRARQAVELCKVPVMIEMAEQLIREGRHVVIFVNFDATINALVQRLAYAKLIRGTQSDRERKEAIAAFQDDSCPLLIANSQAGGTSLNLHDLNGNHPRTAIISPDWDPKKILQVLGRIHRAEGKTPTQQHILFAAGTVEVDVKKVVEIGMKNITIFNDGNGKSDTKSGPDLCQITYENEPKIVDRLTTKCDTMTTVETTQIEQEAHAEFNPSSLGNFEKCPGFQNRQTESEASLRGTRIHKALETDDLETLEEEERPVAQVCKDFIDAIIAEHQPATPTRDLREIRLGVDLSGGLDTFGTCDRLLAYGSHGYMFDYKSGYRHVADAEENPQAWSYVIGAFEAFPELDVIDFYFLIPNQDRVSYHTFTREDIPSMKLRLNTIVRRAMEAKAMFSAKQFEELLNVLNPQPELCEYCAMQSSCPALAKKALSLAAMVGPGLPVPSSPLVDIRRPEDIQHLLRLVPLMESWCKGVRGEALRLNLEEGLEIPGYQRIERSTPRTITSVLGAWDVVKRQGIELEDFLSACSRVSVPQLEELIRSLAPMGEKARAERELENQLRGADLLREDGKIFYLKEIKR